MISRQQLANAIRVLSMDAVQKANSGHPGMPMGMADIAEVLWNDFLKHNPGNPLWYNRDRFILSNGHGSMLQYALLYLSGYDVSIDDLKQFRQLHSKTPGHPEVAETPGVETTTGPLGQGLANAVGMALSEKHLSALFNRDHFNIIDHYTYVFLGDGCLMEGISHEVCSLAGTWKLNKLIAFYDDNGISIDGEVGNWFSDNTAERFRAYQWNVIDNINGHDAQEIRNAILQAQQEHTRPTLIICKTQIAHGAPHVAGSAHAHGAPLGEAEIAATRLALNWPHPPFMIPDEILTAWNKIQHGKELENHWQQLFVEYQKKYPELAQEFLRRMQKEFPTAWHTHSQQFIHTCQETMEKMATRKASLKCIEAYSEILPELIGGSADLTGSNLTRGKNAISFSAEHPQGNYIYYGVREFGMSAILNGMSLYGGIIPFAGTFLTFSDYARNAIRLSALMKQRAIFVYTHDSIGLGEDGPTHQPIEHLAMLRATPNLNVWRPADTIETAVAWKHAIESQSTPSCLCLSRQDLPAFSRDDATLKLIQRGGYILCENHSTPTIILIASGSELQLAVGVYQRLQEKHIAARVVSMPCCEVFEQQDQAYRDHVLPPSIRNRVAIEAASSQSWYRYVGFDGKVFGIDQFGLSAPAPTIFDQVGLTIETILKTIGF
ncbi:MAG: transketolase [Legionellales bacterium]|nr:transketolase [Legionellales bacterium]